MNRRNFLGLMVGGVAAAAAVRTFPFRVFSFPNEPKLWIGTDYGFSGCSSMSLAVWSKENLGSWLVDDMFYVHPATLEALRSQYPVRVSSRGFRIPVRLIADENMPPNETFRVRGREFRVTSLVSDVPHDNALSPTPLRNFLADSSSRFRSGE